MNPNDLIEIAEDITEFITKNGYLPSYKYDELKEEILKHICFGTLMVERDKEGNLSGVVRWNFIGKNTINILDMYIREDSRGISNLKRFLKRAVAIYPQIKWFIYNKRKTNGQRGYAVKEWI